ncbi:MAG: hypothetical protein QXN55_00230 [Candidatus Nitrosotenuis sp.]
MKKPYVYVIVRKDISHEQKAVQAFHATLKAGFAFQQPGRPASIVVLEVPGRCALLETAKRLERKGIEHIIFYEPDFGMGHSAIAPRPVFTSAERKIFYVYPLLNAGN